MPQIAEPITSLEQELESRIEWLEKGLRTIQFEIAEKGVKFVDVRYLFNTAVSYLDGEPTTADEHNTMQEDEKLVFEEQFVRISDVNKEIAVDWKNREREEKIKKKTNMIQSIGYRGED